MGIVKSLLCIQGDRYFTEGEVYQNIHTVDHKTITVFDDEGDDHEINNISNDFYKASVGVACFQDFEGESCVEFTPHFTVGDAQPWDGVGDPPVGSTVAYNIEDDDYDDDVKPLGEQWKDGDEIEILAYRQAEYSDVAVCWNKTRKDASQRLVAWHGTPLFRPIKTEADKAREEALKVVRGTRALLSDHTCQRIADAFLMAGWRKS